MDYIVIGLIAFACGAFAVFAALDTKRRRVEQNQRQQDSQQKEIRDEAEQLRVRGAQFASDQLKFIREQQDFKKQVISYDEYRAENALLKDDLRNLNVNLRKSQIDFGLQQQSQVVIHQKIEELGRRYLKDNVKWISNSLNANNFANCKQRLVDTIERCREIGLQISRADEAAYIAELKAEFERVVRAALEREEQARIKAQIREEQQLEREVQREQARIAREQAMLQEALARALAMTKDEHSAEIEGLKARLAEAEEKQRAISQAQLTKAGFVYVISNIGSFGEGVYKIGMTRRLEPLDRVRELGDASVPFPFDVHMMISCQNAPALENAIHRKLVKQQINKTNPRKEFFRADIDSILTIVRENHGDVEYVADAEALQYRQSLAMPEEDQEYIERVFEKLDGDDEIFDDEVSEPAMSE